MSGAIHGGIKTIRHAVTDSLTRSLSGLNNEAVEEGSFSLGSLIRRDDDDDDDVVIKSAAAASAATKMVNF